MSGPACLALRSGSGGPALPVGSGSLACRGPCVRGRLPGSPRPLPSTPRTPEPFVLVRSDPRLRPVLCCHSGGLSSLPRSWRHSALSPAGFLVSLFTFRSFMPLTCEVTFNYGGRGGLVSFLPPSAPVFPAPLPSEPASPRGREHVPAALSLTRTTLFVAPCRRGNVHSLVSSHVDRAVPALTLTCGPNNRLLGVTLTGLPGIGVFQVGLFVVRVRNAVSLSAHVLLRCHGLGSVCTACRQLARLPLRVTETCARPA